MDTYKRLPLRLQTHKRIYYNQIFLQKYIKRIENFLEETPNMNNIEYVKDAIKRKELKANNSIEGLNDDLEEIAKALRNGRDLPTNKKERIINLNKGYNYILRKNQINKETLKQLYSLLSNGLLSDYCIQNMGDYYRKKPVYIMKNSNQVVDYIKGINENLIELYMNRLFDYINNSEEESDIDNFLKSQIIHYYIAYVHPYFDVNGRTARTTAMWHLLNTEAYPYIIFNRAISFNKPKYYKRIDSVRKRGDITLFLRYMLKEVLKEFEKEKIIHNIKENCEEEITDEEAQIIEYLLTLKGELSLSEVSRKYNAHNVYKNPEIIRNLYVNPLMEKGVLTKEGISNHIISRNTPNIVLAITDDLITIKPKKIKSLNIQRYTSKQP